MSAKDSTTLRTNVPGEITLFSVDQVSEGENGDNIFRINLYTPQGTVVFTLSSKHGFYLDGANFRVNGSSLIELLSQTFSVRSSIVNLSADHVAVTSSNDLWLGGDDGVVLSAVKKLAIFGRDIALRAIKSIALEAVIIGIKARARLELSANIITMNGQVIHGKTPRPVARQGDTVMVATATGPATGVITGGSTQVQVS